MEYPDSAKPARKSAEYPDGAKPARVEIKDIWCDTKFVPFIWNVIIEGNLLQDLDRQVLSFAISVLYICWWYLLLSLFMLMTDSLYVSSCSIYIVHFFEELSHHVKTIKILKEFTRFPGMELDWQESGVVHLYQTHCISEECWAWKLGVSCANVQCCRTADPHPESWESITATCLRQCALPSCVSHTWSYGHWRTSLGRCGVFFGRAVIAVLVLHYVAINNLGLLFETSSFSIHAFVYASYVSDDLS